MVAAAAGPQAAKRKKTADMPDSPPKRVTRARAKATTELGTKPTITKITTASAKAAVEKKQVVGVTKSVKRKTRADDEHDEPNHEPVAEKQEKVKPTKAIAKAKKAVEIAENAAEDVKPVQPLTKTRGRPPKIAVTDEPKADAPKPRGRAKKAMIPAKSVPPAADDPIEEVQPVKRTTRGRVVSTTVNSSTIPPALKLPGATKKVKFQEGTDKDKENAPWQGKALNCTTTATGLKARPVRKPAVARATTRGRMAIEQKAQAKDGVQEDKIRPLSPKKVKQVAKSSSISSEDELCGEKLPIRALSVSPVKPPMSLSSKLGDGVSKLDLKSIAEPASPTRGLSSSVLTSPARRPPQSPFKDALKESPKRVNNGGSMEHPTPSLSQSPAKVLFAGSARRGNVGDSLGQRPLLLSQSPTKASLLRSPARRPGGSPMKMAPPPKTPGKVGLSVPVVDAVTASKQVNEFKLPELSSQKPFTSPLRAAKPSGSAVKVHQITIAEQEAALDPSMAIPTLAKSPTMRNEMEKTILKVLSDTDLDVFKEANVQAPSLESMSQIPVELYDARPEEHENSNTLDSAERVSDTASDIRSTTPPEPPFTFAAPAFDSTFRSPRNTPVESDSEDELSSPQKRYEPTPLSRFGVSTKDFSTPSNTRGKPAQSNLLPSPSNGNHDAVSMTPLAAQLSSWVASSPEKKTPSTRHSQGRGIFSLRGASVLDRPETIVVESPPKTSFFEDQMIMREAQDDQIMDEPEPLPEDCIEMQVSQDSQVSQASEEFGDENVMPIDPLLLETEQGAEDHTLTCTPAKVFSEQPREIHTISTVPLRPAGDDSPRKIPHKRSKSLTGPWAVIKTPERPGGSQSKTVISKSQNANVSENLHQTGPSTNFTTPTKGTSETLQTPKTGSFSIAGTPVGTNIVPDVLKGAVVYVDVHTTEGADASGIFVELLTQMGARCVKQWLWNPRARVAGNPEDETGLLDASTPGGKIGITHVVFKDGGKRTLEKVRESKGVVLCVGVGWVLE